MIDGLFDIAVDTPKYHRRGTLELKSSGGDITARLDVGDAKGLEFSGACRDKDVEFEGRGDLPSLGEVSYRARGSVWGNSVSITCKTDAGKVEIFGTRLSSAAGNERSSHEYMMKASAGDFSDDSTMYSGLFADGG